MIRLKELKSKTYPKEYEELYTFLYSINIDCLFDNSFMDNKGEFNISFHLRNKDMKQEFLIQKLYKKYMIIIQDMNPECFQNYEYQKVEYYSFDNISSLIAKLKELLMSFIGTGVVCHLYNPYRKIYDLISYAKVELIGDDSKWKEQEGDIGLWLFLFSDVLNKTIHVNCDDYSYTSSFSITCYDYAKEEKGAKINEYYTKESYKDIDDLCNALKDLLAPCLRKRRLRDINTVYPSTNRAINEYIPRKRKLNEEARNI